MCGICGVFNYGTGRPADAGLVRAMTDSMIHRGPDDSGVLLDRNLGLGMRRLSIIDLEGGRQPISSEDGTVHIIVNGEIYNFRELRAELESKGHVFRTRCDSEVPLHAYEEWGIDALSRLNGMFGLAIWDSRRRELVLARDPFGVKPLYYRDTGNEFSFGSELRAILADASLVREVDPTGLELFLTFRFVPSPWTALRGIRKVMPGHALVVGGDGTRLFRFHRAKPLDLTGWSPEAIAEELSVKICAAVDRQRVADVPVGVLLSGGLDSTAITSILRNVTGSSPKTFTVGFADKFELDEREAALASAARLGTEHFEIEISPDEFSGHLAATIAQLEEPIATSSALPLMRVCSLARQHVKVVLTGQGADEPFAGYARHFGERWGSIYRAIPHPLRDFVLRPIVEMLPRSERLKRGLRALGAASVSDRLQAVYSIFRDDELQRLKCADIRSEVAPEVAIGTWLRDVADRDGLSQMLYVDTRFSLPDSLLTYTDKMSMASSIEARVPFLDVELMNFAESIPSRLKVRGRTGKWVLRKALRKWLPQELPERPKIAFETPFSNWLRGGRLASVEDRITSSNSACANWLEASEIRRLLREHKNGFRDHRWKLFSLITLEFWHSAVIQSRVAPRTTLNDGASIR